MFFAVANLKYFKETQRYFSHLMDKSSNFEKLFRHSMFLKRILISDFKNIPGADLTFSPKINSITGNNGEGKTNLLDAIYYLSMCKSYFNASDLYSCRNGCSEFVLSGTYLNGNSTEDTVSIALKMGESKEESKCVRKNGKVYRRISDHIGAIPIVMVSPSDTRLINGAGEERRRFANAILSQVDKEYLSRIQRYTRFLARRNKLLKNGADAAELIDVISERMSSDAAYIYARRRELCRELHPFITTFYRSISGGNRTVGLKYTSDLHEMVENGIGAEEAFLSLLNGNRERDSILKYTSCGVQRDDIEFYIDERPIKRYASQGEQKSFLISLKLAQFSLMKQLHGIPPVLLLDDLFDKLDMNRVESLMKLVAGEGFGQIFITDSNKVRVAQIAGSISTEVKFFEVSKGEIYEKE